MSKLKNILGFFILLFVFSACKHNDATKSGLTLGVASENVFMLQGIVNAYNEKKTDNFIQIDVIKSEESKNYKLEHGALDDELLIFDNYSDANYYGDYLYDMKRFEVINNYQISTINALKTTNDCLYVLPSIGKFYTNAINLDALKDYVADVPKNTNDLLTLAYRVNNKVNESKLIRTSSTCGGTDSVLIAFMQIAFPRFFSNIVGNHFLREYINCNIKMTDSAYYDYFVDIFNQLSYVYNLNLYSLDDINNDLLSGIDEFNNVLTIMNQNSIDDPIDDYVLLDNVAYIPYVAKDDNQEWLASKPLYYLSINKNISANKLDMAIDFLEFFSASENQQYMKVTRNRNNITDTYVSYIKDTYIEVNPKYQNVLDVIKMGRVFIVDIFQSIFRKNINFIIQFLKNEISINELLNKIDDYVYSIYTPNRKKINVESAFNFNEDSLKFYETSLGNFYADSIRREAGVDAVIINYDAINENIYNDGFYLDEIESIFSDRRLRYVKIKASDLKKLVLNENLPLISGIRINNGKLYNVNKKEIDDDYVLYVLLDSTYNVDGLDVVLGRDCSSNGILNQYFLKIDSIANIGLDGRYGDYNEKK